MNNKLKIIFITASLALAACDSSEVKMVKGGTLQSCPDKTVEQMVNGYMGNPEWRSLVAKDGNDYVNVVGEISYNNQPTKAEIQFQLNKDKSSFQLYAWELGGEPASNFVAAILFKKMCYADLENLAKEIAETMYEAYEQQKKNPDDPSAKATAEKMYKKVQSLSEDRQKITQGYLEEIMRTDPRMAQMNAEMAAKREASIIGVAFGAFQNLLEAYVVEGNGLGTWRAIGYESAKSSKIAFKEVSMPGGDFGETLIGEGIQATNLTDLAGCPAYSGWSMLCRLGENYSTKCDCIILSDNKEACAKLTPDFMALCQ